MEEVHHLLHIARRLEHSTLARRAGPVLEDIVQITKLLDTVQPFGVGRTSLDEAAEWIRSERSRALLELNRGYVKLAVNSADGPES